MSATISAMQEFATWGSVDGRRWRAERLPRTLRVEVDGLPPVSIEVDRPEARTPRTTKVFVQRMMRSGILRAAA